MYSRHEIIQDTLTVPRTSKEEKVMNREKQPQNSDQFIVDTLLQAEGSDLTQHVEPDTLCKPRVSKLTQRLDHIIPDPIICGGTRR